MGLTEGRGGLNKGTDNCVLAGGAVALGFKPGKWTQVISPMLVPSLHIPAILQVTLVTPSH